MTLSAILISSFLVGLSGALVPGPLTTLALTESARYGARAGTLMAVGHSLLELVTVVALALGLGRWLGVPRVAGTVGLVGTLVLIWMGYATARGARAAAFPLASPGHDPVPALAPAKPLAQGVVVSLANPYWSLWWATIGTTYLALWSGSRTSGLAAFYLGHVLADISWLALLSVLAARGARWLSDKAYRGLLFALGVFLLALALYCGYSALRLLT